MGKCTTLETTSEAIAELSAADTALGVLIAANTSDISTVTTTANSTKTLANDIRGKLKGGYVFSLPTLAIGSTATAVSNAAFSYLIGGILYSKDAVAAGTAPGNDVIPQTKYGAVALDIDAAGTITIAEAADNATGYDSAVLAIAGIPALEATKARMGTVTATKSDGDFTFGTTELGAANTTVAYTDGETAFEAIGAAVA